MNPLLASMGTPDVLSPQPTSSAPMSGGNPLTASKPMFSMTPVQAQPKQVNPLLRGAASLAKGLAPEEFAAGQERAIKSQTDAQSREREQLGRMLSQAKAWTEKGLSFQDDNQMRQFFTENAQDIARTTGQDISGSLGGLSRQGLTMQLAKIDAMLQGLQAPPEPMTAYQQAQIEVAQQARQDKLNEPIAVPRGSTLVGRNGFGGVNELFDNPDAAANLVGRAHGTFIDADTGEQMVIMADGSPKSTGRKAYVPPQFLDMGGGVRAAFDKRTLDSTPLNTPEDVAYNTAVGKSAEKQGTMQGEAAFNLPLVEQRANTAISSIADLKGRNLGSRFGLQSKVWAISGTEGADVQALLNQVKSQAFLNAFDQLRGAGAITEMEGQAATRAITRLADQNISVGEALQAMDELVEYYNRGVEIARQKAVKAPTLPQRESPQADAMPRPTSRAERDALPAGTQYIAPNGEVMTKR